MGYRLGVDVGTTFTAAAVDHGSAPQVLTLGNRALQVPSVLFLQQDGLFVCGEAADRRSVTEPDRSVREFKRRIGDPVPILVAGHPYSPQALTARLLRWVLSVATEREGAEPEEVILTHPANWGGYRLELLRQVAELADVPDALMVTEPEAAAAMYTTRQQSAPEGKLLVYDLGGGTFDACVVSLEPAGPRLVGTPAGVEHLGGVDFDQAVFGHVVDAIADHLEELDPDDEVVRAGLGRLRRDCVEAKEALSQDVETAVPVSLPGLTTAVRMTRSELESLIEPALAETVEGCARTLRSAGVAPEELRAIVLVGGSSRIPLVSHLLKERFGVPLALDTHPKHDVALGALQTRALASSTLTAPGAPTATGTATVTTPPPAPKAPRRAATSGSRARPRMGWPKTSPKPRSMSGPVNWPGGRRGAVALAAAAVVAVVAGVLAVTAWLSGDRPRPVSTALGDDEIVVPMLTDGNWDIWLARVGDGAPLRRLTSSPDNDFTPALSPDRRTVVYVHQDDQNNRTLRIMAADGSGERTLFDPVPQECATIHRPGWSPKDPDKLAVACRDEQGQAGLYLASISAGELVETLPADFSVIDDPAFSPGGDRIAFYGSPETAFDGGAIYTIAASGEEDPQPVTDGGPGQDADPAWAPGAEELIAFRRRLPNGTRSGNFDVFVAPADASAPPHRLTTGDADDQDPSWSPYGTQIAFKSNRVGPGGAGPPGDQLGTPRVWIMAADGSRPRMLTSRNPQAEQSAPAWSRR